MCPDLSQPEEIDLALKETEKFDLQIESRRANMEPAAKAAKQGVSTTNCSGYRAEYMKTHHLNP